jgi:hypothetical protein
LVDIDVLFVDSFFRLLYRWHILFEVDGEILLFHAEQLVVYAVLEILAVEFGFWDVVGAVE